MCFKTPWEPTDRAGLGRVVTSECIWHALSRSSKPLYLVYPECRIYRCILMSRENHREKGDEKQRRLLNTLQDIDICARPKGDRPNPTTHSEDESQGLETRSPCQEGDRAWDLCDIIEGVAGTLHPLNILLLQQGINGL